MYCQNLFSDKKEKKKKKYISKCQNGRVFTIVRQLIYMQLYAKQNQYYALYLDISCLIWFPVETICRKNQIFISWKNMKNVSLCSIFLCTCHI